MEQRAKQRLIGAVILVALGVIFIPMLLKGPVERDRAGIPIEIPPRPQVTPVPDIPSADALYESDPGQQWAKNPPVNAATVSSGAEAERSLPAPAGALRSSASALASIPAPPPDGDAAGRQAELSHRALADEVPVVSGWSVQAGSFQQQDNARALRQALRKSGFNTYVERARYEHKRLFRVRIGPVASRGEAEQLAARLHRERGIEGLVVKE